LPLNYLGARWFHGVRNEAVLVISILKRRLKSGKTYMDFRRAWYHTVGFGAPTRLYSAINAFDPAEIIVVGLVEIEPGQDPQKVLQIDVEERLEHPLEAIIEPEVARTYGIVVSEDDFSPAGKLHFEPASVNGKETDFGEIARGLRIAQELLARAAAERDAKRRPKTAKRRRQKVASSNS
jgi:hypothetical protein